MITLTNAIFENEFFLDITKELYTNEELPIQFVYKFAGIYKELEKKNILYCEIKDKLIKKYGTEEQDSFTISKEKVQLYREELNDLLQESFSIDLNKISYIPQIKLSAATVVSLEGIIDFSELDK